MTRRFKFLPNSLGGRMALILIAGILLLHLVSLSTYDLDRFAVLGDAGLDRISERVASAFRIAERAKPVHRPAIMQDLSDPTITISWAETPMIVKNGSNEEASDITANLRDWLSLPADRVVVRSRRGGETLISIHLSDGSWINAQGAPFKGNTGDLATLTMSTSIAAVGILVLSLFLVRWVTAPLRRLSQAADRIGVSLDSQPLAETGPAEVRQAARAFNSMQERIQSYVSDRTQMFAAISHDLKTPITRLKLRAEFVEDQTERSRMLRDLEDMEQMIGSLLAFLREETATEETRLADLVAVARTVCDDFADAGHPVTLEAAPSNVTLRCRPGAVKRALSNLVDNAVKYGGATTVRLVDNPGSIQLTITDAGPGIPEAEHERIFTPFRRLDASRNRDTGGTGLGLTIARTIARSHGGDVSLSNLEPRGLVVTMTFPKVISK